MTPWRPPPPVETWHVVAGAGAVRPGRVWPVEVAGRRVALGVGARGLVALDARCPHHGAELSAGWMDGDRLRCPLHGLAFASDGACERAGVRSATPLAVGVAAGAVQVHPGVPSGPPPVPDRFGPLRWLPARVERVPVPWATILVNAFDLHHLPTVHRRALAAPPVIDEPAPDRLRMRYATRPIGGGLSDRLTRALAPGALDLHLTLVGGAQLWVEVDLGRVRTAAVVGLAPRGDETDLWLSVGVPPSIGWRARAALARWLYGTFLRRDLPVLRGVHLSPQSDLPEDEPVQRLLAFFAARGA